MAADASSRVDYLVPASLTMADPPCKNQVTNVPRRSADEVLPAPVAPEASGRCRRPMLRLAQQSIQLMNDIVSKVSEPGDTVRYTVDGAFANAQACLLSPNHRISIGDESSGEGVEGALQYVIDIFVLKVRKPKSDIV